MSLGLLGWIDGISAAIVVFSGFFFGGFFLYQARKREAKLLTQLAFIVMFAGLLYLGVFLDFLSMLSRGKNLSKPQGLVALLSYIWFPPTMVSAAYLALGIREHKSQVPFTALYGVLAVIFYILIFLDPLGSFYLGRYAPPGEGLIDYNINSASPAGIFLLIMLAPILIFLGYGAFRFGQETSGTIRTQFLLLGLGVLSFGIFGLLEGLTQPGVAVIFVRIGYLSSFLWMYLGLTRSVE